MTQVRIKKELRDFQKKKNDGAGVEAEVVGKDLKHWIGRLKGPEDSPYEGGIFTVDIKIPDGYGAFFHTRRSCGTWLPWSKMVLFSTCNLLNLSGPTTGPTHTKEK